MRTSARPIAFLVFDEVEALDVAGPAAVLSAAGRHWNWRPFKLHLVGPKQGPVATRSQLTLTATHDLESCPETEYLILPGGYGARKLLENTAVVEWVRARVEKSELVLAVGYGSLLLAKAGVLGTASVAVPSDAKEILAEIDPSLTASSEDVTLSSGKFLSARDSAGSIDIALDLVARTLGKKQSLAVASAIGWSASKETIAVLPE